MKSWILLAALWFMGCTAVAREDGIERKQSPFYYNEERVWEDPSISVCWDPSTSYLTERAWVKDAVERQLEALSNVDFTGWSNCSGAGAEIAIEFDVDVWPSAPVFPREPSSTPNVHLNPFVGIGYDIDGDEVIDFGKCWSQTPDGSMSYTNEVSGLSWSTRQEYCVRATSVHEFMHAISAAHEHYRDDTPSACAPGVGSLESYGYWDLLSAMNYCSPLWNGGTLLSTLDISALTMLYGSTGSHADAIWWSLGDAEEHVEFGSGYHQIIWDVHAYVNTGLYVPNVGDFNGDGHDDIFYFGVGPATDAIQWGGPGATLTDGTVSAVNGTYATTTGDFDGDGYDDIYFYKPTGTDRVRWGRSDKTFDGGAPLNVEGSHVPLAGDFDGDGRDDIFFYGPGGNSDQMNWGRSDRTFDDGNDLTINGTYEPLTGDFDGDGRDDIFFYRPGTGSDPMRWGRADRGFDSGYSPSVNGTYAAAVGDFDGSGTTDIVWSRSTESDGLWLFQTSRGDYTATDVSSVLDGAAPYAGDFNGDGFFDLVWYHPG